MRNMYFSEAVADAIRFEMEKDPTVFCIGEDAVSYTHLDVYKRQDMIFGFTRKQEAPGCRTANRS